MKIIYMQPTIELMGSKNAKETIQLVASGIIKDLNGFKYLVIETDKN
jgi:hypothetical protein